MSNKWSKTRQLLVRPKVCKTEKIPEPIPPGPPPPVTVPCCPQEISGTLIAELRNDGSCACFTGQIHLPWDVTAGPEFGVGAWIGTGNAGSCGRQITLTVECAAARFNVNDLRLTAKWSDDCVPERTMDSSFGKCNPFFLEFPYLLFFPTATACGCNDAQGSLRLDVTQLV